MHWKILLYVNLLFTFRWPLYGHMYINGGAGLITAATFTTQFRRMFKIKGNLALGSTYGFSCLGGCLLPIMLHNFLVHENILKGYIGCRLCLTTRSASIQALSGCLYPMLWSGAVCILKAREFHTYIIPNATQGSLIVQMIKRTSSIGLTASVLMMANFMLGMFLCEKELESYETHFGRNFDPERNEELEFYTDMNTGNDLNR